MNASPSAVFRACWPILEDGTPYRALLATAKTELPLLLGQAHARLVGPGRFSIAESVDVPGCGRTTPTVLVFEAPATRNRRSWVGAVA